MTDLAAPMSMKRKDVEVVAGHGFSVLLDPKRIRLQNGKINDMMEEDEPLAHATAPTIVHDRVNIVAGGKSSEPPSEFSKDQDTAAAPMAKRAQNISRFSHHSLYEMDGKILDMMEEDQPLAHATASAIVHDKVNNVSEGKSSEPPSECSETATAPMEVEADTLQHQPCQNAHFF